MAKKVSRQPVNEVIADKTGRVTRPWSIFFRELFDFALYDNIATEEAAGVVKRMTAIADAIGSSVNVSAPDISTAPAAYNQAYMQSIATLTNENKLAINQIVTDFNATIVVLNSLIEKSKLSGQMTK